MKRASINKKARREIAKICEFNNWTWCMAGLKGCTGEANHPAHLNKRDWYLGKPDKLLWDVKQWISCCITCHMKLEKDSELTKKVFKKWESQLEK